MKPIDWLLSSRYVQQLEKHAEELRSLYGARLAEKDVLIRALRLELGQVKAENERMRSPMFSEKQAEETALGPQSIPAAQAAQGWDAELKKMLQEEEDGIRSRGRIQEHEPGADDGA